MKTKTILAAAFVSGLALNGTTQAADITPAEARAIPYYKNHP